MLFVSVHQSRSRIITKHSIISCRGFTNLLVVKNFIPMNKKSVESYHKQERVLFCDTFCTFIFKPALQALSCLKDSVLRKNLNCVRIGI